MTDEGVRFTWAIVQPPSDSFAAGLTTSSLGTPDLARARAQHADYCQALQEHGVTVLSLPDSAAYPDSTFVEDTAIVTRHGAIIARPGAPSRAGEVTAIRLVLERKYGSVAAIVAPGTLDGGDICQAGNHFFIGLSARTNEAGAEQLTRWLNGHGYTAATVDLRHDPLLLHLKSGIAWLGGNQLIAVRSLATLPQLAGYDVTVVPDEERYAANCVRVNDVVLLPSGYPEITATVSAMGLRVVTLDMSEFRKMDGGLSCLSIRVP